MGVGLQVIFLKPAGSTEAVGLGAGAVGLVAAGVAGVEVSRVRLHSSAQTNGMSS